MYLDDGFGSLGSMHVPIHLILIMEFYPSDRGLSWFGVETTSNFPLESTNQAQPEPKRVAAACANAALNSSKFRMLR